MGAVGSSEPCKALPHYLGAVGRAQEAVAAYNRNSCNALPHRLGAVCSATPVMHCRSTQGQWAVELLQCKASLPGGNRQSTACNALPHRLGAAPSGGSGWCNSCNALPQCLGPIGSGTLAMRELTSRGDGASGPGGGRCLRSGILAMHCHTARGQWAVELMSCTATPHKGSGQWNPCNALPHCLGAVGSGTPPINCLTTFGHWARGLVIRCHPAQAQWVVELLSRTATLLRSSGQCNPCNALRHCFGVVGSGTPTMHCLTAWG